MVSKSQHNDQWADWFASRADSFRAGKVHTENLVYLLDPGPDERLGWASALAAWRQLAMLVDQTDEVLLFRVIVPLAHSPEFHTLLPELDEIDEDLHPLFPPAVVVMPLSLVWDRRPIERYTTPIGHVEFDGGIPPAGVIYTIFRDVTMPAGEPYDRDVVLEPRQVVV